MRSKVPARASWTAGAAIAPVNMPISNQLPGVKGPWHGESPICAPHGKFWRDAPGAIPADSVIVPPARADGTGLDIKARDGGPASRSASCHMRSSGSGGRRPARYLSQGPADLRHVSAHLHGRMR
jgi:hypothetical protein